MGGESIWRRFRRKATAGLGVQTQAPAKINDSAPDTKEAEALAAALNHSAERAQTLWFSFLTFMLYLAIATGTTTHRMLFLKDPLNLPVLNIALPLLGFYILTPVIFVVLHFYMLLNLVLLARTAGTFEEALAGALPDDKACENFRMRIENTLFVQLLVGGRLERKGINAWFLEVMAFITLALAPVALLLMFEVKFLPYHSEAITWLHRGLLALDLALVWTLWPGYRSGWGVMSWPKRSWRLVVPGVLSAAALTYAVAVATFPDERIYLARLNGIAPVNTLDLHGEDLIDDAKLAHIINKNESSSDEPRWVASFSASDRDLTGADLGDADVRHVDFSGAILNRAHLDRAWAENAHFAAAQLQGASLWFAELQGTELNYALLQGASVTFARLQGASLHRAQLQGAVLDSAQLQGSTLDQAQLQGASLKGAQLQGASLDGARLQGASLGAFQLIWRIDYAQLQGASFVDVCVWRADARQAAWVDTRVELPKADSIRECNWTAASFAALKQFIAEVIPEGARKRDAVDRIEKSLDPDKAHEGEDEMAKIWANRESESPTPEAYVKSLAGQWRELGCAPEGAPYVLHGLVTQLSDPIFPRFSDPSDEAKALASAFLDEAHCAGAHGLSEADKSTLKKIAARAAPQAPKP
jgi:uncharacterized protein YjbI with pentapeptide repeats